MSVGLGVVVIGRNEGERLARCLDSLTGLVQHVVYVDSGSSDGSPARARARGVQVVELDPARPFTAARGRNEGLRALRAAHPEVEWVQFLDGDCSLEPGWLGSARAALLGAPRAALAAGRRRELHPEASPYNQLCDMEWNTPVGLADEVGGDFLARAVALEAVAGFDETRIAGEEPELCARLRAAGWDILRVEGEMTRHDADLQRFAQWWRRSLRAGHAAAANWHLVGRSGARVQRRMVLRALGWGVLLPAAGFVLALCGILLGQALVVVTGPLLVLGGWTALYVRVAAYRRSRGDLAAQARLYALFNLLGKPAEALGALRCAAERFGRRPAGLVEYKGPAAARHEA